MNAPFKNGQKDGEKREVATAKTVPKRDNLLSLYGWIQLIIIATLFIALHWYVLNILWHTGKTDPA
ncbi:MAG: hypothetical protein ACOCZS_00310, partial [Verrucomicrobiota bacterium]